jgi:hypothetical protein
MKRCRLSEDLVPFTRRLERDPNDPEGPVSQHNKQFKLREEFNTLAKTNQKVGTIVCGLDYDFLERSGLLTYKENAWGDRLKELAINPMLLPRPNSGVPLKMCHSISGTREGTKVNVKVADPMQFRPKEEENKGKGGKRKKKSEREEGDDDDDDAPVGAGQGDQPAFTEKDVLKTKIL